MNAKTKLGVGKEENVIFYSFVCLNKLNCFCLAILASMVFSKVFR